MKSKKNGTAPSSDEVEILDLGDLKQHPKNARRRTPHNHGLIVNSIQEVGAARSGVVDEDNILLAGNGTFEGLAEAGIKRVKVINANGSEWVVVRRTGLTEKQKTRLALFDNRSAEFAEWDTEVLKGFAADVMQGLWSDKEQEWIREGWSVENAPEAGPYDPNGELFLLKISDVQKKHKNKLLKAVNEAIKKAGLADDYECQAF